MKILSILHGLFERPPRPPEIAPDPLDHPDIRRMSLRELADLPLHPSCHAGAAERVPAQRSEKAND
jgi:hypothetical protein